MSLKYFSVRETHTPAPINTNFQFDTHEYYEILLFLEGDAKFIIEDRTYSLEPNDVIIVRKNELHRLSPNRTVPYSRIVIHAYPSFFQKYECPEYEAQFLNTATGIDNKIPAKVVRSSGLYDAFMKYSKYSNHGEIRENTPVLRSMIMEILYLLNNTTNFSTPDYSSGSMESIILYLNNSFTEDITLDILEKKFFLTKNHLCKAFRNATGITIFHYIRKKRLAKVQELVSEGMNINDAASISGFHDYSSFYRAYKNEFGTSPRNLLK
jgi:AraC-like DNA-binding protein